MTKSRKSKGNITQEHIYSPISQERKTELVDMIECVKVCIWDKHGNRAIYFVGSKNECIELINQIGELKGKRILVETGEFPVL
jgi:hypothetical protein